MNSLRQFVYRLPLIRGLLGRVSNLEQQVADLQARLAALKGQGVVRPEAISASNEKATDHSRQGNMVYLIYDYHFGRTQLPPPGRQPALIVPLDHEDVVPLQKKREPYAMIANLFEQSLRRQAEFCDALRPFWNVKDVPQNKEDDVTPYWNNGYFTSFDANIAYAIVRALRPTRIVEIGSGNSTKFFRKAIRDGNLSTTLTSIDPLPRAEIDRIVDRTIRQRVQDVPFDLFTKLTVNDILFFDGSHLAFHGTDVTYFFLELLPCVAPGVLVHVHDIFLPDEYPAHFDRLYYNEQYMLAAFLLYNDLWEPLVPLRFLHQKGILPGNGGSFWMRRVL